jgi:nucleoside-diphosphate-sugar epimerase
MTIVSPANIYGGKNQHKQDNILFYTNELCKTGKITLSRNSNNNSVNWIYIMDVIAGYQIIFNQGANGNNYNLINSNQYYTDEQLAQLIIKYVKNTTDYLNYIVYDLNILTSTPNEINYDIQTNFTTGQFITTDNFEQEIQIVARCKC